MLEICPKISVVMSVYNGEKYLREAVNSILNQTYKDFEFIIVNDGSIDGSGDILRSYTDSRIRVFTQENKGLAPSLNKGIMESKGELIARMDADDISEPERLERQVAFLEEHPYHVLVGTNALVITMEGRVLYEVRHPEDDKTIRKELVRTSPFHHGSVMFRKKSVDGNWLYPTKVTQYIEDILFFRRLSERGLMANIPVPLYRYRLVPTAISIIPGSYGRKKLALQQRLWHGSNITEKDKKLLGKISNTMTPRKRLAQYYCMVGKALLEYDHDFNEARSLLFKSLQVDPLQNNAWFNLVLTFLPKKWVRRWKSFRLPSSGNVGHPYIPGC